MDLQQLEKEAGIPDSSGVPLTPTTARHRRVSISNWHPAQRAVEDPEDYEDDYGNLATPLTPLSPLSPSAINARLRRVSAAGAAWGGAPAPSPRGGPAE